ncbi:MAG: serine/threonine-protein kinase [bacterium]|nr:serine/threonine-protein kinase [bacterium]
MINQTVIPIGTVLDGRFEVTRPIKTGGMGAVYEVADRALNRRRCALKQMLDAELSTSEHQVAVDRFLSEIQVMQTLHHASIPKVYASFVVDNSFFFVMEYIEGIDLSQMLKREGQPGLPQSSVVGWALQTLDALKYLHNLNPPLTHRDIKPSNLVLREKDKRIMLIDFGISRITNLAEGFWIGTPGYAPVEQQRGMPEPVSDIYALGASMHELLTGRKPRDWDFPTFEDLGVEVDPGLVAVITRALGIWPDERYGSAQEMINDLQNLSAFSISLPGDDREHQFDLAVLELSKVLFPLLNKLIARYANECHTPYLPHDIEFFEFTLATTTPFVLRVVKDCDEHCVRFFEKQGFLEPICLGVVNPSDPQALKQIPSLVDKYVADYEESKSGSWEMGFVAT